MAKGEMRMTASTTRTAAHAKLAVNKRTRSRMQRQINVHGFLLISPWLIGFLGLWLGPALAALYFSFTNYNVLSSPKWIGLGNYVEMFTNDDLFWTSIARTLYYSALVVPLGILGSMILAILLNAKLKGVTIFRTLFFMPSLVPSIAAAILWVWLLNTEWGIVNQGLRSLGMRSPPSWFGNPKWAIPSLVIMGLWGGIGGTRMIIFLAGLQGIPDELYDAAAIDGANERQKTLNVTLPLLTPTIFFNMVLGVIGALQAFESAFLTTQGGPAFATWFFGLHIWKHAFQYFNVGYGSALAWFFAVIIISLTLLQQRLSEKWVFYYGG
jgi:multiple sugar transport system permease protein